MDELDVIRRNLYSNRTNNDKFRITMTTTVQFNVPTRDLGNAGVEFSVKQDAKKFGRLAVRKGSLEWIPRDCEHGYVLKWNEVAKFFEEKGRKPQ